MRFEPMPVVTIVSNSIRIARQRKERYQIKNCLLAIILGLSAIPLQVRAQIASAPTAGLGEYERYQSTDIDSVNLSNGNLYVHIPLVSFPQLADSLKLNFILRFNAPEWTTNINIAQYPQEFQEPYYEAQWYLANPYGTTPRPTGVDVVRDQALTATQSLLTFICVATDGSGAGDCEHGYPLWQSKVYGGPYTEGPTVTNATLYGARDRTGSEHTVAVVPQAGAYPANAPNYFTAPDGSGWTPGGGVSGSAPTYYLDRQGIKYTHKTIDDPSSGKFLGFANDMVDANGNKITTTSYQV